MSTTAASTSSSGSSSSAAATDTPPTPNPGPTFSVPVAQWVWDHFYSQDGYPARYQ